MILTFVNASPVLLMEVMGFSRGDYAITMALTAGVSMVVSFSTPFALGLFKPRTLMLVSQGLFLTAGVTLSLAHTNTVTLFGLTLICAGVASSTLGIAQVCGSSLWIWLAAILGISAMNMLIGILIGCSIVSILLIFSVTPNRSVAEHEEIPYQSRP